MEVGLEDFHLAWFGKWRGTWRGSGNGRGNACGVGLMQSVQTDMKQISLRDQSTNALSPF